MKNRRICYILLMYFLNMGEKRMGLTDKFRARRRQIEYATARVCEQWPTIGKQNNAQKYFQAWQIKDVVTPSGKVRSKRIYCGPYFSPMTQPGLRKMQKILSLLLSLACCVLLYFGADSFGEVSNRWYIAVPQVLCCFGSFFLVCASGSQVVSKSRLMLSELRDATMRLLPSALFVSVMFALAFLAMLIHAVFAGFSAKALIGVVCMLGAFLCAAVVFCMEYRTEYVHVFNENAPAALNPEL